MKYKDSVVIWMIWCGSLMALLPFAIMSKTAGTLILAMVMTAILAILITIAETYEWRQK